VVGTKNKTQIMLLLTATPQIVVPGFWCPVFIYAVLNRAGYRVKKKTQIRKKPPY